MIYCFIWCFVGFIINLFTIYYDYKKGEDFKIIHILYSLINIIIWPIMFCIILKEFNIFDVILVKGKDK